MSCKLETRRSKHSLFYDTKGAQCFSLLLTFCFLIWKCFSGLVEHLVEF